MYKNWSTENLAILKPPATIDEAVDRLLLILTYEDRLAIAGMQQGDLIDLHFTLGLSIRNAFGLYEPGNPLLAACGFVDPDDASHMIIVELWNRLNQMNA
ncbi:hypothetical protein IVG45_17020 [Methylomonas sp. LL1]|uniref:DUF6794 domain-containing protein n=1 Tax=Methylomonas sp. LL1 TaxID=2785785 RepID=UPI0018C433A0|nr:DUF6794 domain-containing protein [Methylomonas sp. LL1]QPK62535.1 hypothetical protein IVG45_17020 [Methylomonas sp. LL1]